MKALANLLLPNIVIFTTRTRKRSIWKIKLGYLNKKNWVALNIRMIYIY